MKYRLDKMAGMEIIILNLIGVDSFSQFEQRYQFKILIDVTKNTFTHSAIEPLKYIKITVTQSYISKSEVEDQLHKIQRTLRTIAHSRITIEIDPSCTFKENTENIQYNNGACKNCKLLGCEYLSPVTYTDDVKPYSFLECINPRTGYCFPKCPKGLADWQREEK